MGSRDSAGKGFCGIFYAMNVEQQRLDEDRAGNLLWRKWGPYLSERQWGSVREDYSADGDAWNYFTHDDARSRAYRWGEDGIAGVSDDWHRLCLALALWNGADPILKERLFGLTNTEGNHGEDVKELYYYLDATPTHSYMRMLYKYPQAEFPYARLREENRRRDRHQPEFELLDTGIFDGNRYFDVFIEYAKASPEDLLMRVTAHNRGPDEAVLHLLPQLWFRNTWSWTPGARRPVLSTPGAGIVEALHPKLGVYTLYGEGQSTLLFCDNDTNAQRLFGVNGHGYFKDAFDDYLVHGRHDAVNPRQMGTKAGLLYSLTIPAGGSARIHLRLTNSRPPRPFEDFDAALRQRQQEADAFYADLQAGMADDARLVQRQAFAGMIWGKQFYHYDVPKWLNGDPAQPPPPPQRRHGRNADWENLNNADVISMPDKWEYPWYASWDLAFHCIPLALLDPEFAKRQLILLTREWYMHPNGQLPAYEWNLGDVNPPVHAWAAWRVFQIDRNYHGGRCDLAFLERVFHKLLLNFTWWVNRKDLHGRNIFQGGFLGLDNIGVFNRSEPLPAGGFLLQADGTSWMAMYCLNLMRISLELALHNHVYEDIAVKFFEHFLNIAKAMTNIGGDGQGVGLWDEQDEFYYDALHLPDGRVIPLKVRSLVGLIPLFAVETLEPEMLARLPDFSRRLTWVLQNKPELARLVSRWQEPGRGERRLLSLLRGHRMKRLLLRMLDESEFLSDYGVRSLSRFHKDHPFLFSCRGQRLEVAYLPGESDSGMFGGNSNWRGPVWFPVNYLIIESLQKFHHYYGDDFKVECPTGSGRLLTIEGVADELARRLTRLFLRDERGRRPAIGDSARLQDDPHFRDYVPFYEYFDGDDGHGLGASHQTGWTGLVAKLLRPRRKECECPASLGKQRVEQAVAEPIIH
jgi:hypothetical protein